MSFSVTSGPPFADITRSFTSISQAARESADSRMYAGIHFRSACEDGLVLGRKIGERAVAIYLQPEAITGQPTEGNPLAQTPGALRGIEGTAGRLTSHRGLEAGR